MNPGQSSLINKALEATHYIMQEARKWADSPYTTNILGNEDDKTVQKLSGFQQRGHYFHCSFPSTYSFNKNGCNLYFQQDRVGLSI